MGTRTTTLMVLLALGACTRSAPKSAQDAASQARVEPADDPIPYQYVVVLQPGPEPVAAVAAGLLTTPDAWVLRTYDRALRGFAMHASPETALAVARDGRVARVSEDGRVKAQALTTQQGAPASLDRIDQREGTDGSYAYESLGGARVHAYVLDTGVLASHLEFLGRPPDQLDFVRDGRVGDCNGHGTHVAGLVGGSTWGVAKEVSLHSLRVLGCDGAGATSDAIAALDWILASAQTPAVANLSFGRGADASLDAAVAAVVAAGIPVVVAAGDARRDACATSPARVPSALTVASTDPTGATVAGFTNQGACVDLFAPGVEVTSASIVSVAGSLTYGESVAQSGTSASAPLVTGAVALYLAKDTGATPDEVATALIANSTRAPAKTARYTPDRFLFTRFVDDDNSADAEPPTVSLDASIAGATVSGEAVAVTATASDDVGVTRVELFANGRFIGSAATEPYAFTWDTLPEPNGVATLLARAYDRAGHARDATVTVNVSNVGVAHFDPALGVPQCDTTAATCDSVELLKGRADLGPEQNAPNTLAYACAIGDVNSSCVCEDGPFGAYGLDESIERITVSTTGGGPLAVGADVEVAVTLYVSAPFRDAVDLYSSPTVVKPAWRYLGTLPAEASGEQTLKARFTLPAGGVQAVRAAMRWGGNPSICTDGGFDERDDLAFVVADGVPDTAAPTGVAVTSPRDGAKVSGPITVSATAADEHLVSRVEFTAGTKLIGTVYGAPYQLVWNSGELPNAAYDFKATAYDGAGNVTVSPAVRAEVKDEQPPIVTISEPASGTQVPSTPLTVKVAATDNGVVRRIDLYWRTVDETKNPVVRGGDNFFSTVMAGVATSSLAAEFEWSAPRGTYELVARAFDGARIDGSLNQGTSAPVKVTIGDVIPPTCSIKLPASPLNPDAIVGTIMLEAEAVDDTQVAQVDFYEGSKLIGTATSPAYVVPWEAGLLPNAAYTLHCVATDTSGGKTAEPFKMLTLTVKDTKPPVVSIQQPVGTAVPLPVTGRITIEASAEDDGAVASVAFKLVDSTGAEIPLQGPATPPWSFGWDSGSVPNGDYDLVAVARDHASLSASATKKIRTADATPPTVAILAPISESTVTGDVTVKAQVADPGGRVVLVELLEGGAVMESSTAAPGDLPYELHWSATAATPGTHALTVRATDLAGNVKEATVSVVVESANAVYDATRQVPSCELPGPRCQSALLLEGRGALGPEQHAPNTLASGCLDGNLGAYHVDESIDFISVERASGDTLTAGKVANVVVRAWIFDEAQDQVTLYYAANADAPVWVPFATLTPAGVGAQPLTASYTLPNGQRQAIRASVRFGAVETGACVPGDYNDHDDLVFAVTPAPDALAPSVSITSPAAGAEVSGDVTITAAASDAGGVSYVEFLVDGLVKWTSYAAPYAWTWPTASLALGPHTLEARATDVAGNQATSTAVTVTVVDGIPPEVSLTAPLDHESVAGTVTLAATASPDVTSVEFLVDSIKIATDTSAPFTATWNTAGVLEGEHRIVARAHDSRNQTDSPTVTAVLANSGHAAFDNKLATPACGSAGSLCTTSGLVNGRGPLGPEPNGPNTLGASCVDGIQGMYHVDESVDVITVRSPTGTLTAGGQAIVEVKVWATAAYAMDALDLFAMDPVEAGTGQWIHVATLAPSRPGAQVLWTTYTLRPGTRQAIRAQLRYAGTPPVEPAPGAAEPAQTFLCVEGTFDDRDDLVFGVLP